MFYRLAVVSMFLFAAACNSPGYVKKYQQPVFQVRDAVFMPVRLDGRIIAGKLLIADQPNLCDSLTHGFIPKQIEAVQFNVVRKNESQLLAPDADKYEVTDDSSKAGNLAFGQHLVSDLNCAQTLDPKTAVFRDGTLEIDHLETGRQGMVSGTFSTYSYIFDTYFAGPEGQFAAQWCDPAFEKFSCR